MPTRRDALGGLGSLSVILSPAGQRRTARGSALPAQFALGRLETSAQSGLHQGEEHQSFRPCAWQGEAPSHVHLQSRGSEGPKSPHVSWPPAAALRLVYTQHMPLLLPHCGCRLNISLQAALLYAGCKQQSAAGMAVPSKSYMDLHPLTTFRSLPWVAGRGVCLG